MNRIATIDPVDAESTSQLSEFFSYLREHIAENGMPGVGYFQPMSRTTSIVSPEREAGFRNALTIPIDAPGWRRLWLARSPKANIIGHIDLRGHAEPHAGHRCLLGMGVHSGNRRQGVGMLLLAHAKEWARCVAMLEWIDLQVLSVNHAAKALYHRAGFVTVGEMPEMFRIDGKTFDYTSMSLRLSSDNVT